MIKGFGKQLLGAFVELPEDKPAETPAKPNIAAPVKGPSTPHTVVHSPAVDPGMLEMLQKKIAGRISPYTALLENAKLLEEIIPDETTRFKAAFKTISKDGSRSVSSITQAIDVHLTDIEGERMRFKQATDAQIRQKSGSLRDQATKLEQQNESNAKEIERLTAQIAKLQETSSTNASTIVDLNNQAAQAEAEIVATAEAFEHTVEYVKNDLSSKKASIGSLLS